MTWVLIVTAIVVVLGILGVLKFSR